jgi:hypothetical protein
MIPKVPSAPTNILVRSKPADDFLYHRHIHINRPSCHEVSATGSGEQSGEIHKGRKGDLPRSLPCFDHFSVCQDRRLPRGQTPTRQPLACLPISSIVSERPAETHHIQHPLPPRRPVPTSVRPATTRPDHPSYRRSWTWVQGKEQRMGQGGEVRVDLFPRHAGLDDHVRVFDCGRVHLGACGYRQVQADVASPKGRGDEAKWTKTGNIRRG